MMWKKILAVLVAALFLIPPISVAQQGPSFLSRGFGRFYASSYTYTSLSVTGTAAGAGTMTFCPGQMALSDGRLVSLFSTNAPITVDYGATQETQTPSTVALVAPPAGYGGPNQCANVTATWTYAHGPRTAATSGSFGLQEAINDANSLNGGLVVIDRAWPGTATTIAAIAPFYNVQLEDTRIPFQPYSIQPTTLTPLATPATRSATAGNTQVISGTATGTWTAVPTYVCVTYVDMLGGESPCSATYNFTPTVNVALNFAAPAASTGAVGWRAYAGVTGYNTVYQLPISSSTCTLSTLTMIPACAMGAAGVFPTPTTTTALRPGYTVNVYAPNTQSHTTFGYVPTNALPIGTFQGHYGPFTATGNIPATNIAVLGTVPMPVGFLNYIGKSIRVSGKITLTAVNTATPTIAVSLGPTFTTGTPTAICTMAHTTNLTAAVNGAFFSCTMTTNATGASGTVMPDGIAHTQLQAGTTAGATAVDTGTAAITNGVDTAYLIYVVLTPATAAINPAQLLDLHVEALN